MFDYQIILKEIEALKWADKYLDYVQLRNKGLKKKAQIKLGEFFADFILQNKSSRREFIDLINKVAFTTNDYSAYLPFNMHRDLLLPEIIDWIKDEPLNPIPYKWSSKWEDNKKSLELNPQDQIAIEKFANYVIGKISMNQHELPHGYPYDGNADGDASLIDFFEKFALNITDVEKQKKILNTLAELKQCAIRYGLSEKRRS